LTRPELEQIDGEVLAVIEDSVLKAKAASKPPAADLHTDVYVSY
jgi:acetoin:2,6-dichlorophenolindophenol oxidoreductase subunit alpha